MLFVVVIWLLVLKLVTTVGRMGSMSASEPGDDMQRDSYESYLFYESHVSGEQAQTYCTSNLSGSSDLTLLLPRSVSL